MRATEPPRRLPEALLARVSNFVSERLGLRFTRDRWNDLEQGLAAAAAEAGASAVDDYASKLLTRTTFRSELDALACHLTIGETYFFRHPQAFHALKNRVLPELFDERCTGSQQLSVWSAGCSTGEEPYSLAMLLDCMVPDSKRWSIRILGTDVNRRSLERAREGVYGGWSFRAIPEWAKGRYFAPLSDGKLKVLPEIQKLVHFEWLNLADTPFPPFIGSMDLILCRNVLMYLTQEATERATTQFQRALNPGGWLIVAPAEASPELQAGLTAVVDADTTLYRKSAPNPDSARALPASVFPRGGGVRSESSPEVIPVPAEGVQATSDSLQEARKYADQGMLADALRACDKALARDRSDARTHYLRGVILSEQNSLDEAARSLRAALYLDPQFAIVYFLLAKLSLKQGKPGESLRYCRNLITILSNYKPEDVLPESGGLTAGRLREFVTEGIKAQDISAV